MSAFASPIIPGRPKSRSSLKWRDESPPDRIGREPEEEAQGQMNANHVLVIFSLKSRFSEDGAQKRDLNESSDKDVIESQFGTSFQR
jgi:hypothetical protein